MTSGIYALRDSDTDRIVYLLRSGDRFKIGRTRDLGRRLTQLNGQQAAFPVEAIHHVTVHDPWALERELHGLWELCRAHGEWFEFAPDHIAAVIEKMNEWLSTRSPT